MLRLRGDTKQNLNRSIAAWRKYLAESRKE